MSTLDVACERCDKRFRVRAEFAGKTTRCPGCSAPITIAGSKPAPIPRDDRPDRPVPRPRPRDDDEDRPRRPIGDWRPVDSALGREQLAVVFALMTLFCGFLSFCLLRAAAGQGNEAVLLLALLLLIGPSLTAGTFGITARVAALGTPPEAFAKGSAVASLLCAIAGVGSLVVIGLAALSSIGTPGPDPLAIKVGFFGAILSGLVAVASFAVFVAQVGIAQRSTAVGRAFGRTAVAGAVCLLVPLGISLLIALASEVRGPSTPTRGGFPVQDQEEVITMVAVGLLLPVALAAMLILYHRLLAAAREAVRNEPV
jgi:hypothetical protein